MLSLGTPLPKFTLPNAVDDRIVRSSDFAASKALVVMFICNHCPFVIHVRAEFGRLYADYAPAGVAFVAINSNSVVSHPQDGPAHMNKLAKELHWEFPYLFDASQDVARAFDAACTPDFYVFDGALKLAYRGQLDDARPSNPKPVNGLDVRAALDAILAGKPVSEDQKPSVGCNIKWA
jgi:peroxiredoxin